MAEESAPRTPQSGGTRFESCSVKFLDLVSVVSSSNPWQRFSIANWLLPVSWDFQFCYAVFELFVSELFE